jgi:L-threonylcarbamoyladenylate synthase
VPEIAWDLIKSVDKPITIIYPGARNLPKFLMAHNKSIAIRIVREEFCQRLIHSFGKPIVSTSANISGDPTPLLFRNISPEIKQSVDYVVNLYQDRLAEVKPSRIIRLSVNGEFEVIRP